MNNAAKPSRWLRSTAPVNLADEHQARLEQTEARDGKRLAGDSSAAKPSRQPGADFVVLLDNGTTIHVPSNASAVRYEAGPPLVLDASMLGIDERAYFQALGVFGAVQ